jgi:hypothetical protein
MLAVVFSLPKMSMIQSILDLGSTHTKVDGKAMFSRLTMRSDLFCRYAVERTSTYMKIWFWSRRDLSVPDEVKFGPTSGTIDTETWVGLTVSRKICQEG